MSQHPTQPELRLAPDAADLAQSLADPTVWVTLAPQLLAWLPPQRWFGGQTRTLTSVELLGWLALPGLSQPAPALLIIQVADSVEKTTLHPLFLHADATGRVTDALTTAPVQQWLLDFLRDGTPCCGTGFTLHSTSENGISALPPAPVARLSTAQQSNSSLIYGEQAILKVYRRLESGPNPEAELGQFLTTEAGFAAVPAVYGVGRIVGTGDPFPAHFDAALLLLQALVPNDGDAWEWALFQCQAALIHATTPDDLAAWHTRNPDLLTMATDLGRITAELHATLATATTPDLAPQPATAADLHNWLATLHQDATATAAALHGAGYGTTAWYQAAIGAEQWLLPAISNPGWLIRLHGDYHLGQVIRSPYGLHILDFEGEPARSLADRRRRQHPLVDVAGMTRSLHYAVATAATQVPGASQVASLTTSLQAALLNAYWAAADAATPAFLPVDKATRIALLQLFALSKALYEVRYELDNRPAMINIPGDAMVALVQTTGTASLSISAG